MPYTEGSPRSITSPFKDKKLIASSEGDMDINVCKYLKYTNKKSFIKKKLHPKMFIPKLVTILSIL